MQVSSSSARDVTSLHPIDDGPLDGYVDHPESDRAHAFKPVALEREILAVFETERAGRDSRELAFNRKEYALGGLFAQQLPAESLALEERLRAAITGDAIAGHFRRLVGARQARLLASLADSRKRHPMQRTAPREHVR